MPVDLILSRAALALATAATLAPWPASAADWAWTSGSFVPGVTAPNPVPPGDRLLMSGVGRKLIVGPLVVTNQGLVEWSEAGDLRLQDGGALVNEGRMLRLGTTGSASMTTLGTGGRFENPGLFINRGAGVNLALSGGTVVSTGTLENQSKGSITLPSGWTNQGTLAGNGSFSIGGGGLVNAGTIAPGSAGVGALTTTNSNLLTFTPSSVLSIDINSATEHDSLDVNGSGSGDLVLAGTLRLNCLDACSMAVGEEISIVRAARSISGSFDAVELNGFATGAFEVRIEQSPGNDDDFVRLRVIEPVSSVSTFGAHVSSCTGLKGQVNEFSCTRRSAAGTPGTQNQSRYTGALGGQAQASTGATFGGLRVNATHNAVANGSLNTGEAATATSWFTDQLTISAPGSGATALRVFVNVQARGTLDAGPPNGRASVSLISRWPLVGEALAATRGWSVVSAGDDPAALGVNETVTLSGNVLPDSPFTLELRLEGRADTPSIAEASDGSAQVTNFTARWGGIVRVEDALTGAEITNFLITSRSGIDWTRAYPFN